MAADNSGKNWFSRHKVLTVIGIIILLIIIGSASGGNKKTSQSNSSQPSTSTGKSQTKAKPAAIKIGETANDGKFAFVVNSIQCGQASVGSSQYLTKNAQGQFCSLNITVKNIGNEAQTLDASNQNLFNAANQKYSADSEASYDANPSGSTFLQQINPGNSVTGVVVFDIPKDQTPVSAELHDSAFSGGVKVSLQQ